MSRKAASSTNIDAYVGREAVVIASLVPDAAPGLVRVGGETWKARHAQADPLPVGTRVRIIAVEGLVLHVSPILAEEFPYA